MIFCDRCLQAKALDLNFCPNCGSPLREHPQIPEKSEATSSPLADTSDAQSKKQKGTQTAHIDTRPQAETCAVQQVPPAPPPPRSFAPSSFQEISGAHFPTGCQPDYHYPPIAPPRQKCDPMSIVSLIFSISSFYFFYIVGAILGLIFGYVSLSNIKRSGGSLGGKDLAITAIILGWVNIGIFAAIFLGILVVAIITI